MLRHRLASLALASGLLFLMSGCCSMSEDGRLFPRLFPSYYHPTTSECGCQTSQFPPVMDPASMPGPMFPSQTGGTQVMPIPITNVPSNQAPQVFKVPTSPTTPYSPTH